jgi:trk system potassium uptake protein TrkH
MRQSPTAILAQQLESKLFRVRPPTALLLSFVGLSLLGALLLKLPIATTQPITWSQALFTAVSTATVTGLAVIDPGTSFTFFGECVLLLLIQFGGLGLMTFGVLVIFLARDRLSMQHRATLSEALNEPGYGKLSELLRAMIVFTLAMEALGTLLLALQWVPQLGWGRGLFFSLFHSVSAFNNAGIGLRSDSLVGYAADPFVNLVITLLFISGGIGFIVVADLVKKRRFRDFALHTKIMLVGTLAINIIATLLVFALEYDNPATLGALPDTGSRLTAAWFQGVTPRSAGFNTVDMAGLLPATVFLIMGLMFIGGGSGSTASGIKLSTFIIMLAATRAFLQAQDKPVVFGRSIESNLVLKAMSIAIIGMFCVVTGTFLLAITEKAPFMDIAFEAVSAFGTVGLSRGLTAQLSMPGQVIVMVLMLFGRVGPLTLAFLLANRHRAAIQYPPAKVTLG